jgi:hypothetical protein
MSPEQATGDQHVGAATDLWALGCVHYEMLVGEPPYTGSTPQAVLGKVITAEPASAPKARRSVPPNVDAAIRRALENVPADRFASARDFARALGDPGFRHATVGVPSVASTPKRRVAQLRWAAGLGVLGALGVWGWLRPTPGPPVIRHVLATPLVAVAPGSLTQRFALSPQGDRFAYIASGETGCTTHLDPRAQCSQRVTRFRIDERGTARLLSGRHAARVRERGRRAVRDFLRGEAPVKLADNSAIGFRSWGLDGFIYTEGSSQVMRLGASGSSPPEPVTTLGSGEIRHGPESELFPPADGVDEVEWLPDGKLPGLTTRRRSFGRDAGHHVSTRGWNAGAVARNGRRRCRPTAADSPTAWMLRSECALIRSGTTSGSSDVDDGFPNRSTGEVSGHGHT